MRCYIMTGYESLIHDMMLYDMIYDMQYEARFDIRPLMISKLIWTRLIMLIELIGVQFGLKSYA